MSPRGCVGRSSSSGSIAAASVRHGGRVVNGCVAPLDRATVRGMDPINTGLALLERFVRTMERFADQGDRFIGAMDKMVAQSEAMTTQLKEKIDEAGKV